MPTGSSCSGTWSSCATWRSASPSTPPAPSSRSSATCWASREVTIVPGNHDYRLAEPLLDRLSLAGAAGLGLEHHDERPGDGAGATIDDWLGPASLRISYPGALAARRRLRHPRPLHGRPPLAAAGRVPRRRHPDPPLRTAAESGHRGRLRAGAAADLRLQLRRRPGSRPGRPSPPPPLRSRLEGARRRERRRRQRRRAPARGLGPQRLPGRDLGDQPPARIRVQRRHLRHRDLPGRRRRRNRAGDTPRSRRRPRDHRPQPPRRAQRRTKRAGHCPAAASCTTPAAGSSPPPSTTRAPRPAPTGPAPSPGSRTPAPLEGFSYSSTTRTATCLGSCDERPT